MNLFALNCKRPSEFKTGRAMDFRKPDGKNEHVLGDYSDFGDEFASLIAQELSERSLREGVRTKADALIDAIQRYVEAVGADPEKSPDEVGSVDGYERPATINAALALGIAKALRKCRRRSINTGPYLVYVAIRSDNKHGRCTDSAQRIAEYLGCSEDVVRDVRDDLISVGALRADKRPGLPTAVWLPYPPEVVLHSDFAILEALAPARQSRGRPPKKTDTAEKTSGDYRPTFSAKPRVLCGKTSGTFLENVGSLTPDSKNSNQELKSSTQEGDARAREVAPKKSLRVLSWNEFAPREKVRQSVIASEWQGDGARHLWEALQAESFPFPPKHASAAAWQAAASAEPVIANLKRDEATAIAREAKRALQVAAKRGVAEWPGVGEIIRQIEGHMASVRSLCQVAAEWDAKAARMAAIERDEPEVEAIGELYPQPSWIDGQYGKKTRAAFTANEDAFAAAIAAAGLTVRAPSDSNCGGGLGPRPSEAPPPFKWKGGETETERIWRLMSGVTEH